VEVESAAAAEVFGQRLQHAAHDARADPLLEAAMTGLIGRVAFRQIRPGGTRPQDIQDTVQDFPSVPPRATTAILAALWFREQWVQQRPLGIGQVSGVVGRHF
jgi:hypothetical protein